MRFRHGRHQITPGSLRQEVPDQLRRTLGWQQDRNLSNIQNAPLLASDPRGYIRSDGSFAMVYVGIDAAIHEMIHTNSGWIVGSSNLTQTAGAIPASSSDPAPYVRTDGVDAVMWKDLNNRIHELSFPSRWVDTLLDASSVEGNVSSNAVIPDGTPCDNAGVCESGSCVSGQALYNLTAPSSLTATTQITANDNGGVFATVDLAAIKSGQFSMTPTVENHDQSTGYYYYLTCNVGPFAVSYAGHVDPDSLFNAGGPGRDQPGTLGVIDPSILADWPTIVTLWNGGTGTPQLGCQMTVASTLQQSLQQDLNDALQALTAGALAALGLDDPANLGVCALTSGNGASVCSAGPPGRACGPFSDNSTLCADP